MTKKISLLALGVSLLAFVPFLTFAQGQDAFNVLGTILNLVTGAIRVLIIFAVAFFIYAVIKYILDPKEENKSRIYNGLIGLFVIVAFWGIIRIVQNTFGLADNNQLQQGNIPCVQGVNC